MKKNPANKIQIPNHKHQTPNSIAKKLRQHTPVWYVFVLWSFIFGISYRPWILVFNPLEFSSDASCSSPIDGN